MSEERLTPEQQLDRQDAARSLAALAHAVEAGYEPKRRNALRGMAEEHGDLLVPAAVGLIRALAYRLARVQDVSPHAILLRFTHDVSAFEAGLRVRLADEEGESG